MLQETHNLELVLASFAADLAAGFTLRNFCSGDDPQHGRPLLLVDDPDRPSMLAAHRGSHFMLRAHDWPAYQRLAQLLFSQQIRQDAGWPDPLTASEWSREGRVPALFIDSTPLQAFCAGIEAGFLHSIKPDAAPPDFTSAHILYWTGKPQLSQHVRQSCRLGRGQELWELLRQGVGYDPEGGYVRECLDAGPSFVCEVNGQPVCWSCTHLNGSMGMIYTPEAHRRQGYGRSLSAFQIDHMLARDGIAQCHVVENNTASLGMLTGLGAKISDDHTVVWRMLIYPS